SERIGRRIETSRIRLLARRSLYGIAQPPGSFREGPQALVETARPLRPQRHFRVHRGAADVPLRAGVLCGSRKAIIRHDCSTDEIDGRAGPTRLVMTPAWRAFISA